MKIASRLRGAISALPIHMLALIAAFAMLLCACGGNTKTMQTPSLSPSAPSGSGIPVTSLQDTSVQAAEVLAAQAPEGVDTELWGMLREELVRELGEKASSQAGEVLPEWDMTIYCTGVNKPDRRLVTWSTGFFRGDGSQNGVVDVADIATIAQHFGQWTHETPSADVADYDKDHVVGVGDISVLARNFGKTCSRFTVEVSEVSRRAGYVFASSLGYDEATGKDNSGFRTFRCDFTQELDTFAWARVTVYDVNNNAFAYDTCVLDYGSGPGPYYPVDDLAVLDAQTGRLTWSTAFFVGDGTGDGVVDTHDVMCIAMNCGSYTATNPSATYADYDHDGVVGIIDADCLVDHYMERCDGFQVEVSTSGPTDGFVADGDPKPYNPALPGRNELGYVVFEYTIQAAPSEPYWVRVMPYYDDGPGFFSLPSNVVEITP